MASELRILSLEPHDLEDNVLERLKQAVEEEFAVDVYTPAMNDTIFLTYCRLKKCIKRKGEHGLCVEHRADLKKWLGRKTAITAKDVEAYLEANGKQRDITARASYDFRGMPPILANEFRLGMQQTKLEGGQITARVFRRTRERLLSLGAKSIFDTPIPSAEMLAKCPRMTYDMTWYCQENDAKNINTVDFAFIRRIAYASSFIHHPIPFIERDKWRSQDLGISEEQSSGRGRVVHFEGFKHEWFKSWVKKYCWYVLTVGSVKFQSIVAIVGNLKQFDTFLSSMDNAPKNIDSLTREHIEKYMMHNRIALGVNSGRSISSLRGLIRVHRELEWQPKLKSGVIIRAGEGSYARSPIPQPISYFVLEQIMAPPFLNGLDHWIKTALLIARYQGLRPSSIAMLKIDCLSFTSNNKAVLSYLNTKLDRNALQPVEEQIVIDAIVTQIEIAKERFPDGTPWLFPGFRTIDEGQRPARVSSLSSMINYQLAKHKVYGEDGSEIKTLPWSGYRDRVATDLLNTGVPSIIVAEWLDHRGTGSIEHYATIHVETMRRALNESKMLNINGEEVGILAIEGDSEERVNQLRAVEDMRTMVKRAVNTVVGGLCTLPSQQRCVHHNRCFTCQHFATTPSDIPVLLAEAHRAETQFKAHDSAGRRRYAEGQHEAMLEVMTVVSAVRPWLQKDPSMDDWYNEHETELDRIDTIIAKSRKPEND